MRALKRREVLRMGMTTLGAIGVTRRLAWSAPAKGEPIRIGFVSALTGALSVVADGHRKGIIVAVEEVNERGGILGRPIELVIQDSELNPQTAVRKVDRLVNLENIAIITGITSSAEALAVSDAIGRNGKALFTTSSSQAVRLTGEKCARNTFRMGLNDAQIMRGALKWISSSKYANGKWYLLGADYEWGHSAISQFKAQAKGAKLIGEDVTRLGETDYASLISKVLRAKPDAVFAVYAGADARNFLSQSADFGLSQATLIYGPSMMDDTFLAALGKRMVGVVGAPYYHHSIDTQLNRNFVERYRTKWNELPSWYAGRQYQDTVAIFKALEKAGSTDVEKLIAALEGLKMDAVTGSFYVRAYDHQAHFPLLITQVVEDSSSKLGVKVGIIAKVQPAEPEVPVAETGCKGLA